MARITHPPRRPPLPLLAAGVALALALLAGARFLGEQRERDALDALVAPHLGTSEGQALRARLKREPDLARARAEAARGLVQEALNAVGEAPAPPLPRQLERLELARRLAGEALALRPASARAATARGAATYLARTLARDDRLFLEAPAWEAPLWRARELAPGDEEPERFLAMAYLELWPALPPWKREEARELVRGGLADPVTFPFLIQPWLAVAANPAANPGANPAANPAANPDPDLGEALALMPTDQARAWRSLAALYEARGDWAAYARILEPWRGAVETEARQVLETTDRRLAFGDRYGSSVVLLGMIQELPLERRSVPLLEELLRRLPAGAGGTGARQALTPWLDWSLELCLLDACPLPAPTLGRLFALARPEQPPRCAAAALLAQSFTAALAQERQARLPLDEAWGPYLILKARYLAARGEVAGAGEALRLIPGSWRDHPAAVHARLAVARAGGDEAAIRAAEAILAAARREHRADPPWRRDGRHDHLAWQSPALSEPPGSVLAGTLCIAAEVGGQPGVEVLWDGVSLGVFAPDGHSPLCLPLQTAAGLHDLELRTLGRGGFNPGAVSLRAPRPPSPEPGG